LGKIEDFKAIKGQIYADLQVAHEKLDAAKLKVRANLRSAENPNGLLTRHEQAYIECLEVKK